ALRVEGEERGLGARERDGAARAAELAAHVHGRVSHDVYHGSALSFHERRLDRLRDASAPVRREGDAVEDDLERLAVQGRQGNAGDLGLGQIQDELAHLDAGEPPLDESAQEGPHVGTGGGGEGGAEGGAGGGPIADHLIRHALGRVAACLAATGGAVDPADLGEEQAEVVVKLGG